MRDDPDLSTAFDAGRHNRAKLGFVLLATEQTIEDDMALLRPDGVGVHFARVSIPDSITVASLTAQSDHLTPAARTLLPDGSLDVICYACTSGSLVLGEAKVREALLKGAPNAKATSLIEAALAALRVVGAQKVAVATPYLDEINTREADYMTAAGFDIIRIEGLNIERDSDMVRLRPAFLEDYAAKVDHPDADALFVSCGALRSLEIVERLEARLGKPVICSNQAMMWHCLRLAGIEDRIAGYGQLFERH